MSQRAKILLIEPDHRLAAESCQALEQLDVDVLRVESAAAAMKLEDLPALELIIAELQLPDGAGLDVIRAVRADHGCAALLMTGELTAQRALEALRLGVEHVLIKPLSAAELSEAVASSLARYRERLKMERRLSRLERLTRRILEDRRVLQQRVDLVCKDLVGAYRDLAQRFTREGLNS